MLETQKNIENMEEAIGQHDYHRLCELAHKMLPTFIMLKAGPAVGALQWLESKRNQEVAEEEAQSKSQLIIRQGHHLIHEAQSQLDK